MFAVFKREFQSFFRNPTGYVALALFSVLSGFTFVMQLSSAEVNISSEISTLRSFFLILIPIITMGFFAEDKKRGTEILYYTSPVSLWGVVIGKFLAALSLFGVMFINVFIHMFITGFLGGVVDIGSWGSVIVYFFLAALFISIGILASSIVNDQLLAACFTFVIILLIQLTNTISSLATAALVSLLAVSNNGASNDKLLNICTKISDAICWFDPFSKTTNFRSGIFSLTALIFCLSATFVFLFLTYRNLEKKRWTQK
ncbi:MAG: ABC transporter permease subunit [Clostridia bacterium]|nr:ABC transporter permease subunit [Clostridia bacterium]